MTGTQRVVGAALGLTLALAVDTASAQIKPATGGTPAYTEPEMARHGGLRHPNQRKLRRRPNAGYRSR